MIAQGEPVFERYNLPARRAIVFALREARNFRSPWILTEHLLLGILDEERTVAMQLGTGAQEAIRKEMEQLAPPDRERIPISTEDLPLAQDSQSALMFAVQEADALKHQEIVTPHLILGLLRVEDCMAAQLLRKHGMEYERYRESLTS